MQWSKRGAHFLLQMRVKMLNRELGTGFKRWYPDSVKKQLDKADAKERKKLRKRWMKSSDQLNGDELMARDEWPRRLPELRETLAWVQD